MRVYNKTNNIGNNNTIVIMVELSLHRFMGPRRPTAPARLFYEVLSHPDCLMQVKIGEQYVSFAQAV